MIETFKKAKKKFLKFEKPDPKPHKIISGLNRLPSTAEMVRNLVQAELSAVAENAQYETFEEANDFDCPDDETLETGYQLVDDEDFVPQTPFVEEPAPEPSTQHFGSQAPQSGGPQPSSPVDNSTESA